MVDKAKNLEYDTYLKFENDIELLIHNAHDYNVKNDLIYNAATDLDLFYKKLYIENKEQIDRYSILYIIK